VQTERDWSIESSTWRYEHCRVEVSGRTSGLFCQTFDHAPPDLREFRILESPIRASR
jgi:hypothetical protein